MTHPFAVCLHGGAGAKPGRDYSAASRHLEIATAAAHAALARGASAMDVVEEAVRDMEEVGLYVAGRGAGPNSAGYVELDASIMDGHARRAGAVCAVRDVVSPVGAARRVMQKTEHVMMAGNGAMSFLAAENIPLVEDPKTYYRLADGVKAADLDVINHGTVGAVALDKDGKLAAATSTGGLFGKREGRVGDTPLIGSGTWADEAVAVSCTGLGESFILAGGAHDVASRVRYGSEELNAACEGMLADVAQLGGDGGVIAVNSAGEIGIAYNSWGMKRAYATATSNGVVVGVA